MGLPRLGDLLVNSGGLLEVLVQGAFLEPVEGVRSVGVRNPRWGTAVATSRLATGVAVCSPLLVPCYWLGSLVMARSPGSARGLVQAAFAVLAKCYRDWPVHPS